PRGHERRGPPRPLPTPRAGHPHRGAADRARGVGRCGVPLLGAAGACPGHGHVPGESSCAGLKPNPAPIATADNLARLTHIPSKEATNATVWDDRDRPVAAYLTPTAVEQSPPPAAQEQATCQVSAAHDLAPALAASEA